MAYNDTNNPITVIHMLRNILCKAGDYGRAIRTELVEGVVVGVPQYTLDERGFRNLLNLAITIGADEKPVLRCYLNPGNVTDAFPPPSFDNTPHIINSVFVNVAPDPMNLEEYVTCVNFVDIGGLATPTPTPTQAPPLGPTPTPTPTV